MKNKECSSKDNTRKCLSKNNITILADLFKAKRPLPIKRIAERNNLSWKTVNDNIKVLEQKKLVKCTHGKRRNYCEITQETRKNLGV